jgi:hypothetical protein
MYDMLDATGIRVVRSGRRRWIGLAHIVAARDSVDPIQIGDQLLFPGADDCGHELGLLRCRTTAIPGRWHSFT